MILLVDYSALQISERQQVIPPGPDKAYQTQPETFGLLWNQDHYG